MFYPKTALTLALSASIAPLASAQQWNSIQNLEHTEQMQQNIAHLLENPSIQSSIGAQGVQLYLSVQAPARSQVTAYHAPSNTKVLLSETSPGFFEAPMTFASSGSRTQESVRWELRHKGQIGVKTSFLTLESPYASEPAPKRSKNAEMNPQFGMIVSIEKQRPKNAPNTSTGSSEPHLGGVAVGALLGGVIGNQFGKGTGKDLATVTGVVGGALIGNEIAKQHSNKGTPATSPSTENAPWMVTVELESGQRRTFTYAQEPFFYLNQSVRIENNQLMDRYSRKGPYDQP